MACANTFYILHDDMHIAGLELIMLSLLRMPGLRLSAGRTSSVPALCIDHKAKPPFRMIGRSIC